MEVADTIIITNQGRIEQIGTPNEICRHPQTDFVKDFIDIAFIFWQAISSGIKKVCPKQSPNAVPTNARFAYFILSSDLIPLDEPFAAIDAKVRRELRTWLKEMINRVGIFNICIHLFLYYTPFTASVNNCNFQKAPHTALCLNQDALARVFAENYAIDWHRGYGATAHSILRSIGEGQNQCFLY